MSYAQHCLDTPVLAVKTRMTYTMYIFILIFFCKEEIQISFPHTRTVPLLKKLSRRFFPDYYCLNLLNSGTKLYLSYLKICTSSDSFLYAITTISCGNHAIYISSYILYWENNDKNIKETYVFGEPWSSAFWKDAFEEWRTRHETKRRVGP